MEMIVCSHYHTMGSNSVTVWLLMEQKTARYLLLLTCAFILLSASLQVIVQVTLYIDQASVFHLILAFSVLGTWIFYWSDSQDLSGTLVLLEILPFTMHLLGLDLMAFFCQIASGKWEECAPKPKIRATVEGNICQFPFAYLGEDISNCVELDGRESCKVPAVSILEQSSWEQTLI